ncbi:cytochrome P450 [Tanacetum coccineum]
MQEDFNRSHSSLRSAIERSFGILKKRWKILSRMPKYSVETQHDVIIATLALHNYIRNNDKEDTFTTFEQHPNYMGGDDFSDVRGSSTNNDDTHSGTSNEMKYIRNGVFGEELLRAFRSDPILVKKAFKDLYEARFNKPTKARLKLSFSFPNRLSTDQVADLERHVSHDEIRLAVWDCGVNKSPGPDGFTFEFLENFTILRTTFDV